MRWHPGRRALQVLCGLLFVALPLTNGLRLDARAGVFYFLWHRMAAHDLVLLCWAAMLGVWGLVTVSFLYGRLWCAAACPQTLASDFAVSVRARLDRALRARPGSPSFTVSRALWAGLMGGAAFGTGIVLACYGLAPATVLHAARAPLTDIPAAVVVYGLSAVLLADLLWVRRKFCSHACPYGAFMSLLADKNTLAVRYLTEREDDCIQCGKCVTDCPMGIDIKQGVGQIDCIGCGECVDACNDVLGRRGKPGLIEFRYGVEPERHTKALTPWQRAGLWDNRRVGVVVTLALCLLATLWQMRGRVPLRATVTANGAISRDAGRVRNGYTLWVENGTPDAQTYRVMVDGLPGASPSPLSVTVARRDSRAAPITVSVPASVLAAGCRVPLTLRVQAGRDEASARTFFYAP